MGIGPAYEGQEDVLAELTLNAIGVTAALRLVVVALREAEFYFEEGGKFRREAYLHEATIGRVVCESGDDAFVRLHGTALKPQTGISSPLRARRQAALNKLFTAMMEATA